MISGIRKQHFFIVFEGAGGNGKSVFFSLLESMFGELMVTINVKAIMGKNKGDANNATPEYHKCLGRLVVSTEEPDSTQLFNTSICKTMGSGGKLSARELYSNSVEFQFNALLIINCNTRPRFKDEGRGMARRLLLLVWPYSFVDTPDPNLPNEKKLNLDLEDSFKKKEYGAALLRMSIVNLYRLVKEVEEGIRQTIVVHPPSVVKDTETYAMQNSPMRVFWDTCVCVETNDVLQLNQIWCEFKKFKDRYYPRDEIFASIQEESQVSSWLKANICRPEKKSRGRHVGVTGYWGYRMATSTEEENKRAEMQAACSGLPVPSSEPSSEPPSELLSGPPTLPHYAPIYVPEVPVPDRHYRSALPPESPSVSSYVPDRDDAGPSVSSSAPEHGDTGPSHMEMDYEMHMEYERHLDMMREEEMMHRAYEEEMMRGGSDEDI
jgi:phage/plasmid-associated DNA primase